MHFFLEDPCTDYKPYMDALTKKVKAMYWIMDEVMRNVDNWGGDYDAFKYVNENGKLADVKENWDFIFPRVTSHSQPVTQSLNYVVKLRAKIKCPHEFILIFPLH